MSKNFVTTTEDELSWPEFVNSTEVKDTLKRLGKVDSSVFDYAKDAHLLKSQLAQDSYKKISARYRQFKHRKINELVTFKIPRTILARVEEYSLSLGCQKSSLVEYLEFLTDPIEIHDCREIIQKLSENVLGSENSNPCLSQLNQ
jgi:hypothetical protein